MVEDDLRADDVEHTRKQAHLHADRLRDAHEVEHLVARQRRRIDDHALRARPVDQVTQLVDSGRAGAAVGDALKVHARDELGPHAGALELRAQTLEGRRVPDEQAALVLEAPVGDEARDAARGKRQRRQQRPQQ